VKTRGRITKWIGAFRKTHTTAPIDLSREMPTARAAVGAPAPFEVDFTLSKDGTGRVHVSGANSNTPLIFVVAIPMAAIFGGLAIGCARWASGTISNIIAIGLLGLSLATVVGAFVLAFRSQRPSPVSAVRLQRYNRARKTDKVKD
jgi:hypothetical protein